MKKLLLVLFLFVFTLGAVYAQTVQVKGLVISGSDMEPLPGVNVVVKGNTSIGTITDVDGNFSLSVPSDAVLSVTYIGFKSQDVLVKGQRTLKIILLEDTEALDEVVVVGYGVQKKANLTGAVASIKSDELLKAKSANSTNTLVGQIPGLISKQAKGEPGADDASLYIRGIATFRGDTSPAFIIDGVERSSADFARMDPNDIESVNVLKDAASAAIFGMRGANGVVVVTTKRGKQDKTSIKYSGNVSIQSPTKLPEFLDLLEEGFVEFFETEVPTDPLKAEFLIPTFIGELLDEKKMTIKVLRTNDIWYGMTYKEDVEAVKESFKGMIEDGVYEKDLFGDL